MTVNSTLLDARELVERAREKLMPLITIAHDSDGEVSKDRDQYSVNIMTWLTSATDELEDWIERDK